MASAVDSRLAYARLSAVDTASRLPTATRGSNNSYTTSWDTTLERVVLSLGYELARSRGSHRIYKHPSEPARRVVVSFHPGTIKRGTWRGSCAISGFPSKSFWRCSDAGANWRVAEREKRLIGHS